MPKGKINRRDAEAAQSAVGAAARRLGFSGAEAEDVASTAIERATARWRGVTGDIAFAQFAATFVANVAKEHGRQRQRERPAAEAGEGDSAADLSGTARVRTPAGYGRLQGELMPGYDEINDVVRSRGPLVGMAEVDEGAGDARAIVDVFALVYPWIEIHEIPASDGGGQTWGVRAGKLILPANHLAAIHAAYRAAYGHEARDSQWLREARALHTAMERLLLDAMDGKAKGTGAELVALLHRRAPAWLSARVAQRMLNDAEISRGGRPSKQGGRGKTLETVIAAEVNAARKRGRLPALPKTIFFPAAKKPKKKPKR